MEKSKSSKSSVSKARKDYYLARKELDRLIKSRQSVPSDLLSQFEIASLKMKEYGATPDLCLCRPLDGGDPPKKWKEMLIEWWETRTEDWSIEAKRPDPLIQEMECKQFDGNPLSITFQPIVSWPSPERPDSLVFPQTEWPSSYGQWDIENNQKTWSGFNTFLKADAGRRLIALIGRWKTDYNLSTRGRWCLKARTSCCEALFFGTHFGRTHSTATGYASITLRPYVKWRGNFYYHPFLWGIHQEINTSIYEIATRDDEGMTVIYMPEDPYKEHLLSLCYEVWGCDGFLVTEQMKYVLDLKSGREKTFSWTGSFS